MKFELKTFAWECDCCHRKNHMQATALFNSRPIGWITVQIPASVDCHGYTHDYCDWCVSTAKKKHKRDEDNHYGQMLRYLESETPIRKAKKA